MGLGENWLNKGRCGFLVPHQANIRIVDAVVKRLKLPSEKVYINLEDMGICPELLFLSL